MSQIIKFDKWYEPAKENRCIHLYLPDGYDQSEERYPVIYMFDGHNLFFDEDASFGKSWGLKTFLDQWPKKMIVVGMECSHTGNDRLKEYSPYRIYARMFGSITGIGDLTMQWIVNEVKPYIDSNYRTWSHREATAIGGSSPAVGFAMRDFRKEVKLSNLNPDTRIFFSWGTHEWKKSDLPMTRNIMELESLVQEEGASTWLYHQQGGRHCEADWEIQIPTWMQFLWG